jgi:hypothetical protein
MRPFLPCKARIAKRRIKVPGVTKNATDVTVVVGVLPARLPARAIENGKNDVLDVPQTIMITTAFDAFCFCFCSVDVRGLFRFVFLK